MPHLRLQQPPLTGRSGFIAAFRSNLSTGIRGIASTPYCGNIPKQTDKKLRDIKIGTVGSHGIERKQIARRIDRRGVGLDENIGICFSRRSPASKLPRKKLSNGCAESRRASKTRLMTVPFGIQGEIRIAGTPHAQAVEGKGLAGSRVVGGGCELIGGQAGGTT